MCFFPSAQHAAIHIQDSTLAAVGGDLHYHASGSMSVAATSQSAKHKNVYQGPLKGASLSLHPYSVCLNFE